MLTYRDILYMHNAKLQGIMLIMFPFSSPGIVDFEPAQFLSSIPPGRTGAEFTITIVDDSLIEAMESFHLLLTIPDDIIAKGVQVGPISVATVTIIDNGELLELCTSLLEIEIVEKQQSSSVLLPAALNC